MSLKDRVRSWFDHKWHVRPLTDYHPAISEEEKDDLNKRLAKGESRLKRLEWEADVLRRRKQNS